MLSCVAFKGGFDMSALVQKGIAQGRPMALAITIALHVALVAGLLAMKVAQVVADRTAVPIDVKWLEEKRPTLPPAELIKPRLIDPGTVVVPDNPVPQVLQEDSISLPPDTGRVAQTLPDELPLDVTSLPADMPLRYQAVRSPDDYYPPQAIRMAAQGAAIVRACVDAGGRLSGKPTVVASSRQSLLDAAAVKWASEALRFQPASRGGQAVASCKEFRVSFTLH
jgi:TonB family protein